MNDLQVSGTICRQGSPLQQTVVFVALRLMLVSYVSAAIGILIGIIYGHLHQLDYIGFCSHAIAWMLVMGILGVLLGMMGARPTHILMTAAVLGVVGVVFDSCYDGVWFGERTIYGLLMGVLYGGTIWLWMQSLRLTFRLMRQGLRRCAGWMARSNPADCGPTQAEDVAVKEV